MAENVLGRIILEAGNKAMGTTGGGAPPISGLLEGGAPPGGGGSDSSKEASGRRFQKGIEAFNKKSLEFAKAQPRWFTSMFKKMGIQMGLAGILKQSQIFTSTVGALFQIFGAFVDVLLAPLIRPLFLPILRWLARRIPDVSRASKAFFNFVGTAGKAIARFAKNFISKEWWTTTVFGGLIKFFTETLPNILTTAFTKSFDFAKNLGTWIKDGVVSALKWMYENTFGNIHFKIGKEGDLIHWEYKFPTWGGDGTNLGSKPRGETSFKEVDMKDTGAGSLFGMKNDKLLNTFDKAGKLLSTEDLTTIEGAWQANEKVDAWLASKGAETTSQLIARQGVTHEGSPGDKGNGKSFLGIGIPDMPDIDWSSLLNPNNWSKAFGDFKDSFIGFWKDPGIQEFLVGIGGVTLGSTVLAAAGKGSVAFGKAMNVVTWGPKQVRDLLWAALKTPGMMGVNATKFAVRQLNAFDDQNMVRTLLREGIPEGSKVLLKRAVATLGSGIKNASVDAWTRATEPGKIIIDFFKRGDAGAELGGGSSGGGGNRGPDANRTANQRPFEPDAPNQGKVQKVLKKFGELKTKFTNMIKGKAGWTISKLKSSFGVLSSLSDEVMSLAGKASLPRIVTYARFIKSLGARLLPFAATAVALGQTGFNIKQIASRSDLSWFSPDEKLLEDRMQPILDMINKGEVGPFGWAAAGAGLNQQALRTVMGTTKAGGIGTQAVLGGLEGILGLGGASTMPLQAALMLASMGHMSSMSPDSSAYAQTVDLESFLADAQIGLTANELTSAVAAGVAEGVRNSTMYGTMDIVGNTTIEYI